MRYILLQLLSILILPSVFCQEYQMRPLETLINHVDPAWPLVKEWVNTAKNKVEVLQRDAAKADTALYLTQVTTKSPMGAIVYETGGILVDKGWIRILGSGSEKMKRSLPDWNKGKSFEEYGQAPPFLLIADDAVGGFFALNGGAFDGQNLGKVYYFSPDALDWEPLGMSYSDFVYWVFTANLDKFYKGLRWKKWEKEVVEMGADKVVNFYPFLWMKHDKLEDLSRKAVPVQEIWELEMDVRKQLGSKH
jgi:Protein of unknown function DUF2625